jgi:hypothetical protein
VNRRLGWLVLAVLWLHQVAIALLAPLSERDWSADTDGPAGPTLGALYHWAIVESRAVHVALTPLAVIALPLGLRALVRGARPRLADGDGDGDDALRLAVIASLLWLAVPQFGLACSFRFAAATHVVTLAAAVWYVAGFRAAAARARAGRPPGLPGIAGLALAGVVAGASTPPVATVTLAVCAVIAARARAAAAPRTRRWAIAGLAGVAIGAALAWATDLTGLFEHVSSPDVDGELRAFSIQLRVTGWTVAGTATLWLVHVAVRRWRGRPAAELDEAELDLIGRALALAAATAAIGLLTIDFGSFQGIAPGAAIATAASVVVVHLAGSRRAKLVVIVLVVAVQAKMIGSSLRTLAAAHREFTDRVAVLAHAPRGSIATVPSYQRRSKDWFFGEDFRTSPRRDRVATLVFGLRGVALEHAPREIQEVPPLALHHEVAAGAAGFPDFYSADLATACDQFAAAVARRPGRARLVADGLAIPDRPGLPVLAAWSDGAGTARWKLAPRRPDREGQLRLVPTGAGLTGDDAAADVTTMWAFDLATGAGRALRRGDDGIYRLRPGRRTSAGIVACTQDRCVLSEVIGLF